MGMSSYILDRVDQFYDIACEKVKECESVEEFMFAMKGKEHMLLGSSELEYIQADGYAEIFNDFWSKYSG